MTWLLAAFYGGLGAVLGVAAYSAVQTCRDFRVIEQGRCRYCGSRFEEDEQ